MRAGSLNPHAAHARSEQTGGGGGGAYARHGEEREEVYALHKAAASTGYTGPSRATDTNLMRQEQWHKCVPVALLRARARPSVSSSASGGEQQSVATPHTGREDGLARAADISSTNLAAASFHKTDSRARDTWVHAGTAER